ncbi:MAG: glycosyltransferase family 2 protein [Burkholderiaceae bacterium]|nr:glycosyltransferase family 2 protein [Burkholderiaceae bacterium]
MIVTYFAEEPRVAGLLEAVGSQVAQVVIVDNTPAPAPPTSITIRPGIDRIANHANLGLAHAQNQGVAHLAARGCTHVVLFDQDSLPAPDMVKHLLAAWRELHVAGVRVAALGPAWRDRHSGRSAPFVRIGWGGMRAAADDPVTECDTLVSSGCLIPLAAFDAIGPMDATLFIDQIDTEWGLRAQRLGYRLYGVRSAVLIHGIGESFVRPWFAPARTVPVHAPVRDYYLVRNTIAVFFRRAAPWRWRLLQLLRLPALIVVLVTQMPPRRTRLRYVARGLVDGLRGRLGAAPAA